MPSWNFSWKFPRTKKVSLTILLRCCYKMSLRVSLDILLKWFSTISFGVPLEMPTGIFPRDFAGVLPEFQQKLFLRFLLKLISGFLQEFLPWCHPKIFLYCYQSRTSDFFRNSSRNSLLKFISEFLQVFFPGYFLKVPARFLLTFYLRFVSALLPGRFVPVLLRRCRRVLWIYPRLSSKDF